MSNPKVIAPDALRGIKVAVSVSDSEDLSRLGLSPQHCNIAIAELARAIMLASGTVVYGGRLIPSGFTDILLDEVRRYREDREALIIYLPEAEHSRLSNEDLLDRKNRLGTSAEVVCLDSSGHEIDPRQRPAFNEKIDVPQSLTAMRQVVTSVTHARVLVGGKLRNYQGTMPGLIEEAILSIQQSKPVYAAGGFGGASAAIAMKLDRSDPEWMPKGYPDGAEDVSGMLDLLLRAEGEFGTPDDGLTRGQRTQLATTHRAADIASLVVQGLAALTA